MEDIIPSVQELRTPGSSNYYRSLVQKVASSIEINSRISSWTHIQIKYRKKECQKNEDNRRLIRALAAKGYTVQQEYNSDEEMDEHGYVYKPATEAQTEVIRVTWGFIREEEVKPIARFDYDSFAKEFVQQ